MTTGACRVWWAAPTAVSPEDAALLSRTERQRLGNFRDAGNQMRFLSGAVMLRRLISDETGVAPADVEVDRSCSTCGESHGRPRLPGLSRYASIAHSGNRVGVALTGVGPVGVDVEQIVPRDFRRLAHRVLRPGERVTRLEEFYRYWTRKESVVKATGAGLAVSLRRVGVSRPDEPARLDHYPCASPGSPVPFAAMSDLKPGDGYVAAITVLGVSSCPVVEE